MPERSSPARPSAAKPTPVRRVDWPGRLGGAVLAAGAIAVYSRTFSVPLLFDDVSAIADNLSLRHGSAAFSPPIDTTAGGRPVLNLSLAINYAISGTAVWSYHALNLAIHVLAGCTLFGIVRRTLAPQAGPAAVFIAFFAALFWSLHPLQTESVTYIVQRAESLMGLFYLLTLYCFVRHAEAPVAQAAAFDGWAALCLLFCLLGMATKEVMVSAPLIVLLYDRTFLAGSFREAWRRRWPVYAGLAATWLVLFFLVRSTHGRGGSAGFGSGVSWSGYALTQFPAIARYLKLSLWPHPLIFDYGTQQASDIGAILPSAVLVVGLVAATVFALFCPGFGWRSFGFAGACFFAILAPTSLVPGNRQTAAEHRMYLALIPVVVLLAIGVYRWLGRSAPGFGLALAVALFGITYRRNQDYRSALVLWTDTVARCPGNAFAHSNLACELENVPGRTRDAMTQCEEALRLKPDYAEAHNNLGDILQKIPGRLPEAIAQYEEALRLKPGFAEAHYNLGNALRQVPGRSHDAIAQYEKALRLRPDYAQAHNNLGNVLEQMPGRLPDAIAQYEEALRLKPEDAQAHNNLGNLLGQRPGRWPDAIAEYEEALRLKPDYAEAHNDLGNALQQMPGRSNDAIAQYEEALRLKPDYAEARYNLGNTLQRMPGRLNDAIAQYEEALRLRPDFAAIHFNLAVALLQTRSRTSEAVAQLEAFLRLQPENEVARQILARVRAFPP